MPPRFPFVPPSDARRGAKMRPPPGGFKTAVFGWVAERLNAPDLKSGDRASDPWVRIPPHPPIKAYISISYVIYSKPINLFYHHLGLLVRSEP